MTRDSSAFIERRIVTGLIVSDDYVRKISEIFKEDLLESATAKTLAHWCLEYFKQYNKAPNRDIQGIFNSHLKNGLDKDQAEDIEDILAGLSSDYEREKFNVDYLLDESLKHFASRNLQLHVDAIKGEIDTGNFSEAEKLAVSFSQITQIESNVIDPFTREAITKAFKQKDQPLLRFGKALGKLLDPLFIRGGFISFMGPPKRGKSFWLLEVAMRALMSDCNVAFFQAGDMSEEDQVARICTYLAHKAIEEEYCGEMLVPVVDCLNNQDDSCNSSDRENNCGLFLPSAIEEMTLDQVKAIYHDNPKYHNCRNESCPKRKATLWFTKKPAVEPLTELEAYRIVHKFRKRFKKQFKLATYPNETLTTHEINAKLDTWERTELFVPDVIVPDYADIMAFDSDTLRMEYRLREGLKWQRLRKISQQRCCLVATATQSDTDSLDKDLITAKNFTETKTKLDHVTGMVGLNQTKIEKVFGIMRLNKIIVRQGDFDVSHTVKVLQRLQCGRVFLGSF